MCWSKARLGCLACLQEGRAITQLSINAYTLEGDGCQGVVGLIDQPFSTRVKQPFEQTPGSLPNNLFAVVLFDLHLFFLQGSQRALCTPHRIQWILSFFSHAKLRLGVGGTRHPHQDLRTHF